MITRQAILAAGWVMLTCVCSGCMASGVEMHVQAKTQPSLTPTATATITPTVPPVITPTALGCLTAPGSLVEGAVPTTKPPQQFLIYLPPCYENQPGEKYPVLYLLHGQTYNQDQWVRLGATLTADQMIHSRDSMPFIMVFPDDRYWNSPAGSSFGDRLINDLIPYIDANYHTLAQRDYRFLGGLSRGGGWTLQLGLRHPELFGALGLHSPAIFKQDAPNVEELIRSMDQGVRPLIWIDVGDRDSELSRILMLEDILLKHEFIHVANHFSGDHSEQYWGAHVGEYLAWYSHLWAQNANN